MLLIIMKFFLLFWARFGWFLPTSMIDEIWNKSTIALDHWKALQLTEVTSQFALSGKMDLLRNVLTKINLTSQETLCEEIAEECFNGLYYPPNHCHQLPDQCAVLISSTPGSQVSFFAETNIIRESEPFIKCRSSNRLKTPHTSCQIRFKSSIYMTSAI